MYNVTKDDTRLYRHTSNYGRQKTANTQLGGIPAKHQQYLDAISVSTNRYTKRRFRMPQPKQIKICAMRVAKYDGCRVYSTIFSKRQHMKVKSLNDAESVSQEYYLICKFLNSISYDKALFHIKRNLYLIQSKRLKLQLIHKECKI